MTGNGYDEIDARDFLGDEGDDIDPSAAGTDLLRQMTEGDPAPLARCPHGRRNPGPDSCVPCERDAETQGDIAAEMIAAGEEPTCPRACPFCGGRLEGQDEFCSADCSIRWYKLRAPEPARATVVPAQIAEAMRAFREALGGLTLLLGTLMEDSPVWSVAFSEAYPLKRHLIARVPTRAARAGGFAPSTFCDVNASRFDTFVDSGPFSLVTCERCLHVALARKEDRER